MQRWQAAWVDGGGGGGGAWEGVPTDLRRAAHTLRVQRPRPPCLTSRDLNAAPSSRAEWKQRSVWGTCGDGGGQADPASARARPSDRAFCRTGQPGASLPRQQPSDARPHTTALASLETLSPPTHPPTFAFILASRLRLARRSAAWATYDSALSARQGRAGRGGVGRPAAAGRHKNRYSLLMLCCAPLAVAAVLCAPSSPSRHITQYHAVHELPCCVLLCPAAPTFVVQLHHLQLYSVVVEGRHKRVYQLVLHFLTLL